MDGDYPGVLELLPHRPPMVLVERLLAVDEDRAVARCRCRIGSDSPLLQEGRIPRMLMIEMLAQSAACLKGYIELKRGLPIHPAYLVRIDDLVLSRMPDPGEAVEVETTEQRGLGDYFVYAARATMDGEQVAEGSLRFVVES
jgi:predicted hotdog family 3-hydroxylacyl-ACP dehydratase